MDYTVTLSVHPRCTTSLRDFSKHAVPCITDHRGWQRFGYRLRVHAPNLSRKSSARPPSRSRPRDEAPHPLIAIQLTPQSVLDRLFPSFSNDGLSVCDVGSREIFINEDRWLRKYPDRSEMSLADYRCYVLNHEIGHALGFDHERCTGRGHPAPIMLQQTLGLHGCTPSPFPRQVPRARVRPRPRTRSRSRTRIFLSRVLRNKEIDGRSPADPGKPRLSDE